jgi:hypothetical protein
MLESDNVVGEGEETVGQPPVKETRNALVEGKTSEGVEEKTGHITIQMEGEAVEGNGGEMLEEGENNGEGQTYDEAGEDTQKSEEKADEGEASKHRYRETKTSIDEGTFAVFNRHRDKKKGPLQKMADAPYTGIHAAARDGNVKQVKKILNKVGGAITADLRTPAQFYSRTALHVSCICGHRNVVEILLNYKADINAQDNWGWTPIMYCAEYAHVDMLKFFVGRGANLSIKNGAGQYLIDVIRAKRDEFEWRDDLVEFIKKSETNLTAQILADEIEVFFGKTLHFTRPKPRYRKSSLEIPLHLFDIEMRHRVGDFGFQWCQRKYPLEHLSGIKQLSPNVVAFSVEKAIGHDEDGTIDDITKTNKTEKIIVEIQVPEKLDPSWVIRYLEDRQKGAAAGREIAVDEEKRSQSKWSRLKQKWKVARVLKKTQSGAKDLSPKEKEKPEPAKLAVDAFKRGLLGNRGFNMK